MRARIRSNLATILLAMVTAALVAGAPTIASTIADYARNADKVDGRHAVGAGASVASRAGKLVATNTSGYLPNNILLKAPDADKLDGFDSTAFMSAFTGVQINQTTPLAAAVQEYWFTFGWSNSYQITWTAVPTATGGKVSLGVEIERAGDGSFTYWLRVTNTGSVATGYKVRYLVVYSPSSPAAAITARQAIDATGIKKVR